MGKRNQWSFEQIKAAVEFCNGNLAAAAKDLNSWAKDMEVVRDKVTRQNLQTWINADEPSEGGGTATTMDNFELTRTNRNLTNRNNKLARELRGMGDAVISKADTLQAIATAVGELEFPEAPYGGILERKHIDGKGLTIELLFSDLQIGKLMDDYDTAVCQRRVNEWVEVVTDRLFQYMDLGYNIDKIVLAVLGDIIESDKKHDNSGRACDIGTADQMKIGIDIMFNRVVKHFALFAQLDVVMITGNHDHDGHGLNMFKPGREHLSWPMYHAVKMLAEQANLNAEFFIPEGSFHVHEIYGTKVLYEHGVGVATSGAAMKKHVGNRIDQLKEFITLFRMGDKHNICRFNNDRLVVNGAFFGDSRSGEEYSGIVGYDGEPAQLMFAHVERKDNKRTTIFDSLAIQLGHVK